MKCRYCKKEIEKETAFKVTARTYACSEKEHMEHLQELKNKDDFVIMFNFIVRDLEGSTNANFGIKANSVAKRLYDKYSFFVLKETLDSVAESVVKYIYKNRINSVDGRSLYCLKVIESNIGYGLNKAREVEEKEKFKARGMKATEGEELFVIKKKEKKDKPKNILDNDIMNKFFK